MTQKRKASLFSRYATMLLTVGGLLGVTAPALADALVVVKVRASGDKIPDGKVTLTARKGSATFTCDTKDGACRIDNVPGGAYTVTFEPKEGRAPSPRPVMIPPEGTVSLYVSAS